MAQSTRRRIRPGYISCVNCDRDLPDDEYKTVRYRCTDGTTTERPYSYCRRCAVEMTSQQTKTNRKRPDWRARRRVLERRTYRRTEKLARAEDRKWRAQMAHTAIGRLRSAGWSLRRIALASGTSMRCGNWRNRWMGSNSRG